MSAFKKEEFEAMIQRESIADFIWIKTWKNIENTNIGLYEMENDRWGCIFQIQPSMYAGHGSETVNKLANFYNTADLPPSSSVQFCAYASRNLTPFMDMYKHAHSGTPNVENREALNELRDDMVDWIKVHADENIFVQGNDLRLRNFVNLVAITIPRMKSKNVEYTESEVISYFSKIEQTLSDFRPTKFTSREWVSLMREMLVPDAPLWFPPDDNKNALNYQVVSNNSTLTLEDNGLMGIGTMISEKENKAYLEEQNLGEASAVEGGFLSKLFRKKKKQSGVTAYTKWKAKTFTTRLYPHTVDMKDVPLNFFDYMGSKISPTIPCPFFLSLIVYFGNREQIKEEVEAKANWEMWQTENLGDAVRFMREVGDRAVEADAISRMIHAGRNPMYASWSCTVMDSSTANVEKYAGKLKGAFMNSTNWILEEETMIPHWVFMSHLPLNFEPYILKDLAKRMNTLFSNNCASITPLVTGESGFGDPVLSYSCRSGQVSGCDIFSGSQTNYNFVVTGDSGSGKSYFMADFFKNYLMTGAIIRVIDVGRAYLELCQTVGGQYIEFTEDSDICLNFFTNIQLDKNGNIHKDELQTLVPLIALMAMQDVSVTTTTDITTPVIKSRLSEAMTRAFRSRQRNAGMQEVIEALEQIAVEVKHETGEHDKLLANLIVALYPFGNPDGEYYRYFNGDNNLRFDNSFVVLELEEIDSKPHLKAIVLATITHIINTEFFISGDRTTKKILAIDEARSIMENAPVMKFLTVVSLRIRKYGGALGIITQHLTHYNSSTAAKEIFATASWKIYLEQSKQSLATAVDDKSFGISPVIGALLQTVKKKSSYYSEVLIQQESGGFFLGRLITDKSSHWLYTSDPSEIREIKRISEEFGVNRLDARRIIGRALEKETSFKEEYLLRMSEGKLSA